MTFADTEGPQHRLFIDMARALRPLGEACVHINQVSSAVVLMGRKHAARAERMRF